MVVRKQCVFLQSIVLKAMRCRSRRSAIRLCCVRWYGPGLNFSQARLPYQMIS
ncbi:UNVERIFIED_CONTAM: hypothetical protein GTU68_014027 [Idotea baltica]|nr:hypothetical protein [Idotea baltica]